MSSSKTLPLPPLPPLPRRRTEDPYKVRFLAPGTMLAHMRNWTSIDTQVDAQSGLPTWYWRQPTFFAFSQQPPDVYQFVQKHLSEGYYLPGVMASSSAEVDVAKLNEDRKLDFISLIQWRIEDRVLPLIDKLDEVLQLHLGTDVSAALQKDLQKKFVRPLAFCQAEHLLVDVFQVQQRLPLLFLHDGYTLQDYGRYVQTQDKSFVVPPSVDENDRPSEFPFAQYLFDHAARHEYVGWISQPLTSEADNPTIIDEVMLTADAGPPMVQHHRTLSVKQYLGG